MMKKLAAMTFCVLLPMMAQADDAAPAATPTVTPELQQKFSYSVGRDIAKSLQPVKDALTLDALKQGLDDAYNGKPGPYSDADLQAAKSDMAQAMQARMLAAQAVAGDANLKAADEFLKKNGKRKGVVTTASGLQYEVITAAKGPHPKESSNVTVHYRGTLLDGTEFDSSYTRGTPVSFPLNNVILGWTEGVQLMAKGAKYRFFLPPALGYGDRGAGDRIGPNSLLIFEIELISFDDTPPEQQ
jgi:FKBP-type peptidyl-prolyl cis-trans isomerase FkpA